jgi:hypothetical protein
MTLTEVMPGKELWRSRATFMSAPLSSISFAFLFAKMYLELVRDKLANSRRGCSCRCRDGKAKVAPHSAQMQNVSSTTDDYLGRI